MTKIGNSTITKIINLIEGVLYDYEQDLDRAYRKSEGDLTVSLSVKIKPGVDPGQNAV
ncbi:MAG: hypothetical protein JRJ79_17735, partial [Deltaproteobacteria bacterium]|nr:hypothetical protein [Deltaproteobacteria bacterium]